MSYEAIKLLNKIHNQCNGKHRVIMITNKPLIPPMGFYCSGINHAEPSWVYTSIHAYNQQLAEKLADILNKRDYILYTETEELPQ